jgi:iron complex outermembrane receptor protein
MKRSLIRYLLLLCSYPLMAQNRIEGTITDQDNEPLLGATVFIADLNKGTISNENGEYQLLNIPNGKHRVQFSYIGFANLIETAELHGESIELDVRLQQTAVEADEVVVSGFTSSTQHDNAAKIEVLKLDPHAVKTTPNFSEVIAQVPGVDMISKGSGVSRPVIRGLSMNDILVLNNGVRFENYQYSEHHPLGIDEFGIANVEVIKGPASLLYGSDAIGGVINFIKENPAPVGSISGDYNLQLFSNTLGMTNNFGIKGTSKKFFGGVRAGQKTNADFLQGGGAFAPNSRFNEMSVKANTGFTGKIGSFKLFYDFSNQKLGLVEDEAIEEITQRGRKNSVWYQQFNTHLIASQNKLYLDRFKLVLNAAYQSTELIHVGEADAYEIQMRLSTLTYDARLHLPSRENSEYIIGIQGFNQINTNLNNRETKLLPDAVTESYSAFGFMQHTFLEKLKLQTGIRYDLKSISTQAIGFSSDTMTYREAIDKDYGSFSGSFGATYSLTEEVLFRANFAAAYRTPNLAELTSNGQHELRYEIGDQNLVPENAYETDLSFHIHDDHFTFDIAGFYNLIRHYIFISPTGDTTSSGISIYRYLQANSALFGGEAGLHIHPKPVEWLHIETTFASVIGKQENGDYLPFVPAHKLRFELRLEKEDIWSLKNGFIAAYTTTAFDQNKAAPDETTTSGYTLLDLSIGGSIKIRNQLLSISISANNLFDKKYMDHLSTLKEVGLFNPGRNLTLNVRVPFSITKKLNP